jgi:hypothetical protein
MLLDSLMSCKINTCVTTPPLRSEHSMAGIVCPPSIVPPTSGLTQSPDCHCVCVSAFLCRFTTDFGIPENHSLLLPIFEHYISGIAKHIF